MTVGPIERDEESPNVAESAKLRACGSPGCPGRPAPKKTPKFPSRERNFAVRRRRTNNNSALVACKCFLPNKDAARLEQMWGSRIIFGRLYEFFSCVRCYLIMWCLVGGSTSRAEHGFINRFCVCVCAFICTSNVHAISSFRLLLFLFF